MQRQVRETLEKLQGKSSKGKGAKYRREKRDSHRQKTEEEMAQLEAESKVLKATEFVTVSELATMMNIQVTQIISACMSLGMMVTMGENLYSRWRIRFRGWISRRSRRPFKEDLKIAPIVGDGARGWEKSLLDYIREENVIAGESEEYQAHCDVSEGQITFLDTLVTRLHYACSRGSSTDLVIIVIAADDDIMPQTKKPYHAAAGVPIVFAINKIDRLMPTQQDQKFLLIWIYWLKVGR